MFNPNFLTSSTARASVADAKYFSAPSDPSHTYQNQNHLAEKHDTENIDNHSGARRNTGKSVATSSGKSPIGSGSLSDDFGDMAPSAGGHYAKHARHHGESIASSSGSTNSLPVGSISSHTKLYGKAAATSSPSYNGLRDSQDALGMLGSSAGGKQSHSSIHSPAHNSPEQLGLDFGSRQAPSAGVDIPGKGKQQFDSNVASYSGNSSNGVSSHVEKSQKPTGRFGRLASFGMGLFGSKR